MVSEAQKRSKKKYTEANFKNISVRLRNEKIINFKEYCTACGLGHTTAARLVLESIAAGDPDALALLRRLAAAALSDNDK